MGFVFFGKIFKDYILNTLSEDHPNFNLDISKISIIEAFAELAKLDERSRKNPMTTSHMFAFASALRPDLLPNAKSPWKPMGGQVGPGER